MAMMQRERATVAGVPATMRAIVQDVYGNPGDVLRAAEVPVPTIDADEVLVRVAAAGVDRGVWHLVTGKPYLARLLFSGLPRPRQPIPGLDLAGTVVAVGSAVTRFAPGEAVFGIGLGTFAQYARAKASKLAAVPAGLDWEHTAVIGVSGLTALQALRDHARVQPRQRVLILGASGGVGTFAVQIARAYDAEVTAVCSAAKLELVRSLGADHVMDYAQENPCADAGRYDAIIDIGGNRRLADLRRALTSHGRLIIVGGETSEPWLGGVDRQLRALLCWPFIGQKMIPIFASEHAADLDELRSLIESGRVTPVLDRVYPLDEAAAALRYLAEGRARGKVAIRV